MLKMAQEPLAPLSLEFFFHKRRNYLASYKFTRDYLSWCADHCDENKDFHCFSQSDSFACFKECRIEPEKTIAKTIEFTTYHIEIPPNCFVFFVTFVWEMVQS